MDQPIIKDKEVLVNMRPTVDKPSNHVQNLTPEELESLAKKKRKEQKKKEQEKKEIQNAEKKALSEWKQAILDSLNLKDKYRRRAIMNIRLNPDVYVNRFGTDNPDILIDRLATFYRLHDKRNVSMKTLMDNWGLFDGHHPLINMNQYLSKYVEPLRKKHNKD